MKFTDNRTKTTVPFGNIKVGECFITSYDGHINMKMCTEGYDSDGYNTVDLVTGKQYFFDDHEEVITTNAEVIATN